MTAGFASRSPVMGGDVTTLLRRDEPPRAGPETRDSSAFPGSRTTRSATREAQPPAQFAPARRLRLSTSAERFLHRRANELHVLFLLQEHAEERELLHEALLLH